MLRCGSPSSIRLTDNRLLKRLHKKAKRGMRGWPVATIAFYGPNLSQATKVAVGIVPSEGAPCVRQVAAQIGSEPLGARISGSGSIRTSVQRSDSGETVAAGEFVGGACGTR